MIIELTKGQSIQITGPAKVHVIDGELSLLGGSIKSGEEIIIKAGKQYPFQAENFTKIEVFGEKTEYCVMDTPLIPMDRKILVEKLSNFHFPLKIMLLGGSDTGKTTVVCYLANYFLNTGNRVAVIDLDMGQQDIGPPCTITLGILKEPITQLGDIPLKRMVFIGQTSPVGRMLQIVSGANELVEHALEEVDVIIIDTTGWISGGAARAFKSAKIRTLKPHVLVGLQQADEITHLFKPFESSPLQIELLSVYPNIPKRNLKTRKFLRESKFNSYFKDATPRLLDLNDIQIANAFFHSGNIMKGEELEFVEETLECNFIYAERAADGLFLVKKYSSFYNKNRIQTIRDRYNIKEIRIVNKNDEKGLVVGLSDKNLNTLGIGIIESINYESDKIRIYTPVMGPISTIQLGYLKITKTGQELEAKIPLF